MGPTLVIERLAMPRRAPVSASASPSPGRAMRTPSISRVFAAALLAIAVAGLVDRWTVWQSARRTQGDMVDLTHRLERVAQLYPSPGIETQIDDLRELAAEVGDRSEEHTSELQSLAYLVCRLLLEKKKKNNSTTDISINTQR